MRCLCIAGPGWQLSHPQVDLKLSHSITVASGFSLHQKECTFFVLVFLLTLNLAKKHAQCWVVNYVCDVSFLWYFMIIFLFFAKSARDHSKPYLYCLLEIWWWFEVTQTIFTDFRRLTLYFSKKINFYLMLMKWCYSIIKLRVVVLWWMQILVS